MGERGERPGAGPSAAGAWRRTARRAGLVLAALPLALCCAEGVMHVWDPYGVSYFSHLREYDREALRASSVPRLLFEHRPGADLDIGVRVRINSLGLRGPEIAVPKPAGTRRLLVLGDSVAFGWGVEEHETFAARMGDLVARRGGAVEVVNGGVVHYNTMQEMMLLESIGPRLQADAVLLVYTANDAYVENDSPIRGGHPLGERPPELAPFVSLPEWWMLSNNLDLRLCHFLRFHTLVRLAGSDDDHDPAAAERRRTLLRVHAETAAPVNNMRRSLAALKRISNWCRRNRTALAVAPFDAPEVVEGFCRREHIIFLTGADRLVQGVPDYRISATDAHPNAQGHRILADEYFNALVGHPEFRSILH